MNNSYVKKINWDSTKDPIEYPKKIRDIFFKLFIKNRKKFASWVGKISINNFDNLIKLPFTRDPYKSDLFKNLLILKILRNKNIVREIDTVILDKNLPTQFYLRLKKNNNLSIIIKNKKNSIFLIFKVFIANLIIFFLIKSLKIKKIDKKKHLLLFNTHLSLEGEIRDFVFPGLYKILKKKKINNFYFVPDIIFSKDIISFYKNLKKITKQNYIFKENYISFLEFLNCFISTIIYRKKENSYNKFYEGIDCSFIIKDELKKINFIDSEFQSKLKLIFIEKLKKNKFKLKKSWGRFENQPTDKAWFYGMRKYYPNSNIFGFQGFLYYPHLLNQSPTKEENKLKILPKKIIVTSKIAKNNRDEFFKHADITLGPSLGKQDIFKKIKFNYEFKFVLALCGIKSLDEKLISWMNFCLKKDTKIKFAIKPHPILPINKLENYNVKLLKNRCKIINENIYKILEKTEILISSGPTGVIFESLIYGCKLFYIVLDPSDVLMFKNIPNKNNYTLIKDKKSLLKNLQIWKNKRFNKSEKKLKNLFFTKINNKNVRLFY